MPAKSQAQRGLIFSRRDQYGSKKNTPKRWKWVWDEDWENKGKLPKRKKKKKSSKKNECALVSESLNEFMETSTSVDDFAQEVKQILVDDFGADEWEAGELLRTFWDKLEYSMEDGWDAYQMAEYFESML
jgi:hypothetical protein